MAGTNVPNGLTIGGGTPIKRWKVYSQSIGSPAAVTAASGSTVALTVPGISATDIVDGVIKPTNQAGLLVNAYVSGNNQITVTFTNVTAASITPTASEVYKFAVYSV